jgi:hypothetical protein
MPDSATPFVVRQVVNFVASVLVPTMPILGGGTIAVAGGAIIFFWKPA